MKKLFKTIVFLYCFLYCFSGFSQSSPPGFDEFMQSGQNPSYEQPHYPDPLFPEHHHGSGNQHEVPSDWLDFGNDTGTSQEPSIDDLLGMEQQQQQQTGPSLEDLLSQPIQDKPIDDPFKPNPHHGHHQQNQVAEQFPDSTNGIHDIEVDVQPGQIGGDYPSISGLPPIEHEDYDTNEGAPLNMLHLHTMMHTADWINYWLEKTKESLLIQSNYFETVFAEQNSKIDQNYSELSLRIDQIVPGIAGVSTLNGLTGQVYIRGENGINIRPEENTLVISSTGGGGGDGSITVVGAAGPEETDRTFMNISTLKFDKEAGFTVSEDGQNAVEVSLGSSWTELIPDLPGQELSGNYRGEYETGKEYNTGSIVLHRGNDSSLKYWKALHGTTSIPGESSDWEDITTNFRPSGEEKLAIKAVPAKQTGTYWDYLSTNKNEKTFVIGVASGGETVSDITVTGLPSPIGSLTNGTVIPAGKQFQWVLEKMLRAAVPPVYTNPVFNLALDNCESGVIEYGRLFSHPAAILRFKQNNAGLPLTWSLSISSSVDDWSISGYGSDFTYDFEGAMLSRNLATLGEIKYKTTISAAVCYDEGEILNDSFGNPYPETHIMAGCTNRSLTITPSRYIYYAADSNWHVVNTEETVKRLAKKFLYASQGSTVIDVSKGTKQVTIAIPLSKIEKLTSMIHKSNSMDVQTELITDPPNPQVTILGPITVIPETGVNSENDSYNIYTYRLSTALDDSGTITIKYKTAQ